jgi:hypothetical protein|tara:strand:- start:84 stop:335 length:252 start_codon:yes stop_codon:yes gene_type:complete
MSNTYAFLTKDNFRIDVEASTPKSAYNKLNCIPHLRNKGITRHYYKYAKDGFVANYDVRYLREEYCEHCGLPKDECPGYKCWT